MRETPYMKLRNVQTNNIWKLTDREQIGKCFKQTFNSQVSCERWVDGQKKEEFIIRSVPRFAVCTKKIQENGKEVEVFDCHPSLLDLIPKDENVRTIRDKMLNEDHQEVETLEDLKKFCFEKGIHHHPNIGYEKLKTKVDKWREFSVT